MEPRVGSGFGAQCSAREGFGRLVHVFDGIIFSVGFLHDFPSRRLVWLSFYSWTPLLGLGDVLLLEV